MISFLFYSLGHHINNNFEIIVRVCRNIYLILLYFPIIIQITHLNFCNNFYLLIMNIYLINFLIKFLIYFSMKICYIKILILILMINGLQTLQWPIIEQFKEFFEHFKMYYQIYGYYLKVIDLKYNFKVGGFL